MYFFTADEHYYHKNIIRFCNRPFLNLEEMHNVLISNFNEVVKAGDITIHAGDFSLGSSNWTISLIERLNGSHIFISGSHDRAIERLAKENKIDYRGRRIEIKINNKFLVIDHYCLRVWARSHYNSYHLYGHSHGRLDPIGKSWDVGVDNNNFYPVSFEEIKKIMEKRPDNPNLIKVEDRRWKNNIDNI